MTSALGSTNTVQPAPVLRRGEVEILRTILYYHIFRFPLRSSEVHRQTRYPFAGLAEVEDLLGGLVARGLLQQESSFFHLGDAPVVVERLAGEARARAAMPRALRRSRFVALVPFVRGVAVSGTLSKGVMRATDDLDFMVFTEPGRLWICRALLMGFKKLFLLNSHRNFCINYLLATDQLEIPDRDIFTASEIAWLLPTSGGAVYARFVAANRWIQEYFPNWEIRPAETVAAAPSSVFRGLGESALGRLGGDRLDDWCRRFIARRNRRRYRHLDAEQFEIALRAEKHASKHHPQAFQHRTLIRFREVVAEYEAAHGVVLG